jgi:hypothetical protein
MKVAAASSFKVRVFRPILFLFFLNFLQFDVSSLSIHYSMLILFSFWNVLLFIQVHKLGFDWVSFLNLLIVSYSVVLLAFS